AASSFPEGGLHFISIQAQTRNNTNACNGYSSIFMFHLRSFEFDGLIGIYFSKGAAHVYNLTVAGHAHK
ncbi:MAG: hypothetical protein U9N19_04280, partial [Thermodesulfobacteriota bacterium]|nr:hypothetical protein [Thermodesulfobacteriota bacterium]